MTQAAPVTLKSEFCVLVGTSGEGRKGDSWDHVEAILWRVDPSFARAGVG